jgi:F-type H+-transporting ATPase subunit b
VAGTIRARRAAVPPLDGAGVVDVRPVPTGGFCVALPRRSLGHLPSSIPRPSRTSRSLAVPRHHTLRIACLAFVALACGWAPLPAVLEATAVARASDDHAHGHADEIGSHAPAGVSQKWFESPAYFQKDLAVWSFVIFLTLLALLTKFAWKPIMEGLEKREEGIARQIAETKSANDEAKRMLASYERRLAEASEEVREMLEEARRDAEATKQAIVAEARKASEDERNRAKHEIQLAKDDALSQIAEKAGQLAVEVAGKFLRDKLGADDQSRLVRESVASLSSRPSVN